MDKAYELCKILIPIDFSNTSKLALEHAAHICEKFGSSSLHLLHVLKNSSADLLPNVKTGMFVNNTKEIKKVATKELEHIGKEFKEKYNLDYQVEVKHGNIAKEITRTATSINADLIVMGTHGVSGFEEFFLGSNAYRVVTSSSVPTLTVQCHAHKVGFNNIVLPVDSSKHTRDKVAQAAAIAEAYDATVHIAGLITKLHRDEEPIFNLKIRQIKEFFNDKEIKYTSKIIHGNDIAEMTIDFAKEVDACLTVIMTEQETSSGLFLGPYAQRVVNHSEVPILSVTPKEVSKNFFHNTGGSYHTY